MRRKPWIPVALTIGLALMAAYGLHQPKVDHAFTVLGEQLTLKAQVAAALPRGPGAVVRRLATNAERAEDDTAPAAGAYVVSTWSHDERGQVVTRRIRFRPGPYVPVEAELVARRVADRFDQTVLSYTVRVEGAVSADGTEHALFLQPTFHDHRAACALALALDYDEGRRGLVLEIDEQVGEEARRYTLDFLVGEDGAVTRAP